MPTAHPGRRILGRAQRTAATTRMCLVLNPSAESTLIGELTSPTRCREANNWSPERSPVNTRPVRLPPCAAGANPSTSIRGRPEPHPVTGRPQYGCSANALRLTTATSSRQATRRGQARQTLTAASSAWMSPAASASSTTCRASRATGVSGSAGSPGHPAPGGTGRGIRQRFWGEASGSRIYAAVVSTARGTTTRGPVLLILSSAFLAAAANGISMVAFPGWCCSEPVAPPTPRSWRPQPHCPCCSPRWWPAPQVDFLGRRPVAMLSDTMSALSVAAIPALVLSFGDRALTTVVLAALAAAGSFFDPGGMTARQSMLPEAATRAGWTFDHTNSMYEAAFSLAYITGPGSAAC